MIRIALIAVVVGCAAARPPAPAPAPPSPQPFDVHIGFWVNLHQRLFAESGSRPVPDPLRAATPEDQARWDRARDAYRTRYADRTFLALLEHDELVRTNRALAALADNAVVPAELPAELRTVLADAAPVYRADRWAADRAAALAFRDRLAPLVARVAEPLTRALATAYTAPWPAAPIRVDIAAYAGPVGAYTVVDPAHITIASTDRRHAGDAALEIMFHEASHALAEPMLRAIAEACPSASPTLWHAALFWTTGELVRRQLGASYTPYAYHNGLYTRDPSWTAAEPILARVWPQYLDGKLALADAAAALCADQAR